MGKLVPRVDIRGVFPFFPINIDDGVIEYFKYFTSFVECLRVSLIQYGNCYISQQNIHD